jgi:hypothetical protein
MPAESPRDQAERRRHVIFRSGRPRLTPALTGGPYRIRTEVSAMTAIAEHRLDKPASAGLLLTNGSEQ